LARIGSFTDVVRCKEFNAENCKWKKNVDIFDTMLLKSIDDKYCGFYEALIVLLIIQTSEFHKIRQCNKLLL
jgi:hypothetical protein